MNIVKTKICQERTHTVTVTKTHRQLLVSSEWIPERKLHRSVRLVFYGEWRLRAILSRMFAFSAKADKIMNHLLVANFFLSCCDCFSERIHTEKCYFEESTFVRQRPDTLLLSSFRLSFSAIEWNFTVDFSMDADEPSNMCRPLIFLRSLSLAHGRLSRFLPTGRRDRVVDEFIFNCSALVMVANRVSFIFIFSFKHSRRARLWLGLVARFHFSFLRYDGDRFHREIAMCACHRRRRTPSQVWLKQILGHLSAQISPFDCSVHEVMTAQHLT